MITISPTKRLIMFCTTFLLLTRANDAWCGFYQEGCGRHASALRSKGGRWITVLSLLSQQPGCRPSQYDLISHRPLLVPVLHLPPAPLPARPLALPRYCTETEARVATKYNPKEGTWAGL